MVFTHLLAFAQHLGRQLHGADVRACADLRGTAHGGLLAGVFDQAHFIQQRAHVALLVGGHRAVADTRTQGLQPAVNAGLQCLVGGKREPDNAAVIQQLGHLHIKLGDRERGAYTQYVRCGLWPKADAIPNLALQVFGIAKQGSLAIASDHQPAMRLGKPGEVIKVAVSAVQKVAVAVALLLGCRGDDGDAAFAQLCGQGGAAFGVEGRGGVGIHGGSNHGGEFQRVFSPLFKNCSRSGVPTSVHCLL